jgi:ATP-dependent helicase/nuclease subunit B
MPVTRPRVFNIPASVPFLRTLCDALLAGTLIRGFPAGKDPAQLAQATIYLPTRRACRLAREVFLEASSGGAVLPRIAAIGDIDEDEILFADAATGAMAPHALDLPEAITPLERRLRLAGLISEWAKSQALHGAQGAPLVANTPASALALADDLARLMDDMTTRGVGWDQLEDMVRETNAELDQYWQLSLEFLKIARERWPQYLADNNLIEPADRRDRLIDAEAERLKKSNVPVIAAGSTGSMPATAKLLATIAQLPNGAVVLPGLDMDLDEASWRAISESADGGMPAAGHPQFAMHALLARMGIARADVENLGRSGAREAFISEVMRPAGTTELWSQQLKSAKFSTNVEAATTQLAIVEAGNAEEEALAIAVALREALETSNTTAAMVTPDRALARRVLSALDRWSIKADDSGGDRLADTPAGVFARLAAETALGGAEPVPLLALLKHIKFRLGKTEDKHARAIAALERAVLRGPRPKPGSGGLAHALDTYRAERDSLHGNDPRKLVAEFDIDAAQALVKQLATALEPLETLPRGSRPLAEFAELHRDLVVALSSDSDSTAAALVGPDGMKLSALFDELAATPATSKLVLAAADYVEMFETIAAASTVRMREKENARVRILGPLEARLQSFDRMVLGGLNEGTWPPDARTDPWLSRPMRQKLGLNLPELRIGLTAHDFAQALGTSDVMISRAAKVGGAPAVASRFVQRIAALAGKDRWKAALDRGEKYLNWARALDDPGVPAKPIVRPEPKPPLAVRPDRLSVTDIENWLRDPYTIYAKHVLRLFPLDAVDTAPGAADRGSIIHEAIGDFTRKFAQALPADPEQELIAFGRKSFAPLQDFPEARAFWWPRFLNIARWFAAWERERRPTLVAIFGEIKGALEISLDERIFTLSARADRIERRSDGSYAILDYKTGAPPTEPQVRTGLAPQLTLEAAILRSGRFANVPAGSVSQISYVRLKGGEPPGEPKDIKFTKGTPDFYADDALKKLTSVARKFLVEDEPYRSLVHPMWKKHYGEYDHLARVKEWAASGGESEAEP